MDDDFHVLHVKNLIHDGRAIRAHENDDRHYHVYAGYAQ